MSSNSTDDPFHILSLNISNIQRIKAVALAPSPEGLTVISGEMAQGKTSILDAIEMLFKGKDAVSQQPVRAGEESGRIEGVIGPDNTEQFMITRKFTGGDKTYLEIRAADGSRVSSPQAFLDSILSSIGFYVMDFADPPGCRTDAQRRTARTQMLLERVKLPIDLKAHDEKVKEVAADRTAANKEADRLSALISDTSNPETGRPSVEAATDPVDEEPLVRALAQAETEVTQTAAATKRVVALDAEIAEMQARLKAKVTERQEQYQLSTRKAEDIEPHRRRLDEVRRKNEVRKKAREDAVRRDETMKSLGEARDRSAKLSQQLQELRDLRARALAEAPFPVKALSINEAGDVTIRNKEGHVLPFDQASHGQRMLASFALMATTSKLRVALIRDGNDLSPDGMRMLAEIAKRHRYQLVVERWLRDQPNCIVIHDGMVADAGAAS